MKHFIVSTFTLLFILCAFSQFYADDSEFFSYYVTPDVWIILDTSGSMTWDMNGCYTFGDGSEDYEGRDTDGDSLPNDSRMYIVKNALYNMVSDPEIDIRWGLAAFYQEKDSSASDAWYRVSDSFPDHSICNPDVWSFPGYRPDIWWHGATKDSAYEAFQMHIEMAEGASAHINEILRWIDNVSGNFKELRGQGGTPLPGALRGVRYEYMSKIPSDNAKWCRGYYVLLLTDGEPTYGIGSGGAWAGDGGTIDPLWQKQCKWEADSLMHTYIAPHGGDPDTVIPIKTYVVGIGLEGSGTLDSIAKYGGTEEYYPATNPQELQEVLRAIISDIINQATSYSGAEVTSIQEQFITQNYEARMYICSFVPSFTSIWEGHLKAVKLIAGTFQIDSIPDSLVYWDAGENLKNTVAASRNIYSEKGYSLVTFNAANITALDLDVATNSARDSIINTVYAGSPSDTMGYLSDVFHSTPLRIHGPNYFYEDDDFYKYRDSLNINREPMIYAGANDGMLHCFNDSTGDEMWAFIPNDQLPNLKHLLTEHRYYEDADAMAADIWFPSSPPPDSFKDKDEWRTVLIFGQRQGGWNYSALDVTDPYNPFFLFNFDTTMANLGETWSDAVMFKIHKNTFERKDDRYFAFLGGGYWPDSLYDIYDPSSFPPFGNAFYALDVVNMCGNTTPIMGIDYWKIPAAIPYADSMLYPFPAQPSVIDTNLDSYHDILYIGDVGGQLWKVVLNDANDSSSVVINNWEAEIIFKAPKPASAAKDWLWQPIFFPATPSWDGRRWWLFFGTGDRARAEKEGTVNRFYAIIDSNYTIPLEEADLKRVSVDGSLTQAEIIAGTYKGWYIVFTDFDNTDSIGKRDGEKVTSYAIVLMDTLIFTTFQPYDLNDPCVEASGVARLYKIHYATGSYSNVTPSEIVGSGLPQAPRYTFDIAGQGFKIINLPGEVIVEPVADIGIRRKLLWWHETH